jgi:hypothetical protein
MEKKQKFKWSYVVIPVIILLGANLYYFQKNVSETSNVDSVESTVKELLLQNSIFVNSKPAIYNIKDLSELESSVSQEVKNQAEQYDQVFYYKTEKLLVLYRPKTESIISVETLSEEK